MPRYFQYIDKNDEAKCGQVTELLYIDDSDPNMTLYHFSDGGRCNPEFIADINDNTAFGKCVMAEVENKRNIWKIEKKILEYKEKTAVTASGEQVVVPDLNMMNTTGNFIQAGNRYTAQPPKHTDKALKPLTNYYLSYISDPDNKNDVEIINNLPEAIRQKHTLLKLKEPVDIKEVDNSVENTSNEMLGLIDESVLSCNNATAGVYIKEMDESIFHDKNIVLHGKDYSLICETDKDNNIEHFCLYNKENDTPIWDGSWDELNDIINKSTCNDTAISQPPIKNKKTYDLVNDMINAANKEECEVDMSMILHLPPVELYNVLKSVYGKEYTEMFVLNLAYNLPGESLRQAIAQGLQSYYDPTTMMNEEIQQ